MVFLETYGAFLLKGIALFGAFLSLTLLGLPVARKIRPDCTNRRSTWLWGVSIGLTLYGTALALSGFAGFYTPTTCALLLLAGPLSAVRSRTAFSEIRRGIKESLQGAIADLPAAGVTFASVFVLLPAVLAPEIFYDALYYHLGLPSQYLLTGWIPSLPDVVHASFPATIDLVFGAALALGGVAAAKGLGLLLLMLALAATAELAGIFAGRTDNGDSWPAVAILACVPGVAIMATLSSVDVGMAFAGAMALAGFVESRESAQGEGWRPLILAAFPLALLAGSKYTGLYLVAALVPLVLSGPSTISFRERCKNTAAMACPALLLASPWYVRNLLVYGNPVYPAFPGLFGGSAAGSYALDRIARDLPHFSISQGGALLSALLSGRLGAGGDPGILLPIGFLTLAVLGIGRRQWKPLAVASFLFLLLWGTGPKATRYLYPVFPAAAVAGGAALSALSARGRQWRIVAGVLLLGGASVNIYRFALVERALYNPGGELASLLSGASSRDEYLNAVLPYTSMARWANGHIPKEAVILFVGETRPLYFERRVLFASAYDAPRLARWVAESTDGAALAARLRREGITHVLINGPELSRLRKGYGYMTLNEKDTSKVRELVGTMKLLKADGAIRLAELPVL